MHTFETIRRPQIAPEGDEKEHRFVSRFAKRILLDKK